MSTHHIASPPDTGTSPPPASSQNSPPGSPRGWRKHAPDHSHWTPEKAGAFLRHLGLHGNVAKAARAVGMSRKSAYALRARAPEFARLWQVAKTQVREMRKAERIRRRLPHPLLDTRVRSALGPRVGQGRAE